MPSKKKNKGGGGGLFSCFGGGADEQQPEIRYEPENGGAPQTIESDFPMPDIKELDEKFAAVVVRFFFSYLAFVII